MEERFADLFAESGKAGGKLTPGQQVNATVVSIAKDWIFIDLGGKSEGVVAKSEFLDSEGNCTVQVGESVTVYFLSARKQEKLFTTKVSGSAASAHLEEAFHSGIPVEGTVEQETKGGFLVKLGNSRAFCPHSQMGLRRVENAEIYLGQRLPFKIMEFREGGKNILLSHRQVLEAEREQRKEELQQTLKVGDRIKGTVTSIQKFGAFVDINGIEGLIPASEIGWGEVRDIHGHLNAGQQVEVVVKNLDWAKERYSFSLKETLPDPWDEAAGRFPEGSIHKGVVSRLADFGAFVTLAPGIDGLVHVSNLGAGRKIHHPREVVQPGMELEVRVDALDVEKHRLSLSIPAPAGSEEKPAKPEKGGKKKAVESDNRQDFKEYAARKPAARSLGTFADLLKGKVEKK
jgi:small subunit ribosomal protein S1